MNINISKFYLVAFTLGCVASIFLIYIAMLMYGDCSININAIERTLDYFIIATILSVCYATYGGNKNGT